MKQLPVTEKPYEKCIRKGASSLSDAELLAVILKTGTKGKTSLMLARELLQTHPVYEGLMGLHHLSMHQLLEVKGMGTVKTVQLMCLLELSKRLSRVTKADRDRLQSPEDVASYFMDEMRNLETEHLYAAFMDASGHLLHTQVVFKGTIKSSLISPRELLRLALQYDAAQYVILHNHPSGDPQPSQEDLDVTAMLCQSSNLIGIPLMDHLIIGDNQYISLREWGYVK